MTDEITDPEAALDRLDAALERIARARTLTDKQRDAAVVLASGPPNTELTARLDGMIARLRAALGPARA
jgi:hypothetical protein